MKHFQLPKSILRTTVSAAVLSLMVFSVKPAQTQFGWKPNWGRGPAPVSRSTGPRRIGTTVPKRDYSKEKIAEIVGVPVGGIANGVLSQIKSGTAGQVSGMSYEGNTLSFGEPISRQWQVQDTREKANTANPASGTSRNGYALTLGEPIQRQWQIRDEQGNIETVDAKEWKIVVAGGIPRFVLLLADGREQEYSMEGLDREEDLEYLCGFLLKKLDEFGDSPNGGSGAGNALSENVAGMTAQFSNIKEQIVSSEENSENRERAKQDLEVLFRYLNDELCSVSLDLAAIGPGTEPGQNKTLRIRGETCTFRWCPAGEFTRRAVIGQKTAEREDGYGRDFFGRPIKFSASQNSAAAENIWGEQRVSLSQGFWILDSEVTQQMYYLVMGGNARGSLPNPLHPAARITWNDANEFCGRLNEITHLRFALPTKAQWQYACLADGREADLDAAAWYSANSVSNRQYVPHDIKTKEPNAWGIYDMQGNISEWCADWDGAVNPTESAVDPIGPATGTKRVVCGGNYTSPAENCRFDYAVGEAPESRESTIGFRLILIPDPEMEDAEKFSEPDNTDETLPGFDDVTGETETDPASSLPAVSGSGTK